MAYNIYNLNYDWITQREMREHILMDNLVHTDYYLPAMRKALLFEIKDYICRDLFEEINNELNANAISIVNEELRRQLVPAIAAFTTYYALKNGYTARIENIGTVKQVDATTAILTSREESYMRANFYNEAVQFRAEAICFLRDNISDYPTARQCFVNICKACNGGGGQWTSQIQIY